MSPKRAFIIIIGLVILSIIGGAVAYWWADQNLNRRALEISRLKADLDIIELKTASAQNAANDLERLAGIKDVVAEVLPPSKIQSNVVGEISAFARNRGISLESINFAPSGNKDNPDLTQTEPLKGVSGVNTLPLTINIRGNYGQIINFLRDIERNQRKMQINTITLNPTSEGDINSTLTINVYVKV